MELRTAWFVKELKNGLLIDPTDLSGVLFFSLYGYGTRESALGAIRQSGYRSMNLVILENPYWVVED